MTILAKQAEIATTNPQAIDEWLNNYLASNYGFTLEEYQQFRKLLANKFHAFKERNGKAERILVDALNATATAAGVITSDKRLTISSELAKPELMGKAYTATKGKGSYYRLPDAYELSIIRGEVVPEPETKSKSKKTKSTSEAGVSPKGQALVIESAETFEETPSDASDANQAQETSETFTDAEIAQLVIECRLESLKKPTGRPSSITGVDYPENPFVPYKVDNVYYIDFGDRRIAIPDYPIAPPVKSDLWPSIDDDDDNSLVKALDWITCSDALQPPATDAKEEWAKFWFGLGFKLFPLKANSKLPACKHGFKDAVDNLQALKALGYDSKTNLAIATGDTTQGYRVVVLDIDTKKGKDGHVVISKLAGKLGTLPATLTAKTPSGGRHLFFKHPADKEIKSSSDLFKDLGLGFDTRSMGGYVAAAPSTIDGVPYVLVTDLPVAELPAAWLDELATKALPPNTPKDKALGETQAKPSQPSLEAFSAAFGTTGNLALSAMPLEQPKAPNVPTDVLALLKSIDASLDRVQWLQVLSALSAFSDGYDVARSWSATSPTKFDRSTWDKDWSRALEFNKGTPASIGVIANLAKAEGAVVGGAVSLANSFDASGVTEEELQEIASDMFERARSGDYDLMNTLPQALIDPAIRAKTVKTAHEKLFETKTAEQQANIKRPLFVDGKLSLPNLAFLAAKQLTLRLMVESGALPGAKISDDSRAGFVSAVAKALLRTEFAGQEYKTLLDNIGHGVRNAQLKSNTTLQRVSTGIPNGEFKVVLKPRDAVVSGGHLSVMPASLGLIDFDCPKGKHWRDHLNEVCAFMSKHFAKVMYGKKAAIASLVKHEFIDTHYHEYYARKDLNEHYDHILIQIGEDKNGLPKYATLIQAFARWKHAPTFDRIVCDSRGAPAGVFNTWRGFTVQPTEDAEKIKPILGHIFDVICDSNQVVYEYTLDWIAHSFQFPEKAAGAALVWKGKKGTGKGIIGNMLHDIWGLHATHLTNTKHLTSNFNSHLQDKRFVLADEAFFARDKAGDGVLKGLITEPTIQIERKGLDAITCANYAHILMMSNEDYVVPATSDERRYCVTEVSDKYRGDTDYFDMLGALCESKEGKAAFLYAMVNRDITKYRPSRIPETQALKEQRAENLDCVAEWIRDSLIHGGFFSSGQINHYGAWLEEMPAKDMLLSYEEWSMHQGGKRREYKKTPTALGSYLGKLFEKRRVGKHRIQTYILGTLEEVIKKFEAFEKITLDI